VRYYGTYHGKFKIDNLELISYLVDIITSDDLNSTFYEVIDVFLGSGGGVNNTEKHANGGGAIILKGSTFTLYGNVSSQGYPLNSS